MNIKCLFGFHDWEVCKVSDEFGWVEIIGGAWPVKLSNSKPSCPATDSICLRCGKRRYGIWECEMILEEKLEKERKRNEEKKRRKKLAEDMCNLT